MKKQIRVVMSVYMIVALIVLVAMTYAILIFSYCYPPARPTEIYDHILLVICAGVLPTLVIIFAIPRGVFSVVTINEKGAKRSFCGRFLKTEMSWAEMAEVRYYWRILPTVFFSKTVTLDGMTYEKIIKRKDVIQLALSQKVLNAIKQFTDKEIINLPEKYKKI